MDFQFLFTPLESVDATLSAALQSAPLAAALLLAAVLGLRHASDPDHLIAVTAIVSSRDGDVRAGVALGAWWGIGHAATLLSVGIPLIVLQAQVPAGLEAGAERVIGFLIVALAIRLIWRWAREGFRRRSRGERHHGADRIGQHQGAGRGPAEAAAIGLLHGLAGSGAVVVLLIAALPSPGQALAALAAFAPMSVLSMAACTGAYAWLLTRPRVVPVYRRALMPAMAAFGLLFGVWYAGV